MTLSAQGTSGMDFHRTRAVVSCVTCKRLTPAPPVWERLWAEPSNCTRHPCQCVASPMRRIPLFKTSSVACNLKCTKPQAQVYGSIAAVAARKGSRLYCVRSSRRRTSADPKVANNLIFTKSSGSAQAFVGEECRVDLCLRKSLDSNGSLDEVVGHETIGEE